MKTFNVTTGISEEAKAELVRIINTHDRYKKAYFFTPCSHANGRRSNEERFIEQNPDVQFITSKGVLEVRMQYSESCKNVYYTVSITLDRVSKNITAVKNLLK